MEGWYQKDFLHAIPAMPEKRGARINVTWRWIVPEMKPVKGGATTTTAATAANSVSAVTPTDGGKEGARAVKNGGATKGKSNGNAAKNGGTAKSANGSGANGNANNGGQGRAGKKTGKAGKPMNLTPADMARMAEIERKREEYWKNHDE